jgi:L-amino acid N-acyltransferase YncA
MDTPSGARVRVARPEDAAALAAIYAWYVQHTAITFEETAPDAAEFRRRIGKTLERYPYLVLEAEGGPAGYAYAGPFKDRAAYDWSVETSIYLRHGAEHHGYGRRLHDALEQVLARQGIQTMCACIAMPRDPQDPYLTDNSRRFHEHLGYRFVGRFERSGYRFGRWYDMIWMEKAIGSYPSPAPAVRPFTPALLAPES